MKTYSNLIKHSGQAAQESGNREEVGTGYFLSGNFRNFVQPKLTIGSSEDPYEHEADSVANHVMRMPESRFSIQRKCATCEHEEEKIQRKPYSITPFVQKSGIDGGGVANDTISSQIESSRGGGSPMAESTRSFMESRFGNDFSGINIHTDSNAIQLSQNLNAQAFTVGNDVFFNQGKYNPDSDSGKHLLAHELVHTLQQGGEIKRKAIQKKDPELSTTQIKRDDHLRRLAVWANEAHAEWKRLSPQEQVLVLTYMTLKYGIEFSSAFDSISRQKRRPAPVAYYTNVLTESHEKLRARGYRFVGTSWNTEHWIHPSGNTMNRILPSKPSDTQSRSESQSKQGTNGDSPATQQPEVTSKSGLKGTYEYGGVTYDKTGKVISYPIDMGKRCAYDAINNTKNEEECSDRCVEKISADDAGCMTLCISSCQDYFDD